MKGIKSFFGYTAVVRQDDVDVLPDLIQEMRDAGMVVEILNPKLICSMFQALSPKTSEEEIWPKGYVYLIPPTNYLH